MQQKQTEFGFLVVLEPGDELIGSLIAFARIEDVGGAVCFGTGRVREVDLGVYDSVLHDFNRREFNETFELCSLTGNIALLDGEPLPQLHGVFARHDFSVLGGRIFQAVCETTLEITVHTTEKQLIRRASDARNLTGLRLELPA